MKVYEVSLADEYKRLLAFYPELEKKVKRLLEEEKDWHFDCAVPVVNSITNYVDDIWVSKKMFNVKVFEENFYVDVEHPLRKIVNEVDLDAENWMSFQRACREQWEDNTDIISFFVVFTGWQSTISIPKKYIFRLD